jgi:hypothetical protein
MLFVCVLSFAAVPARAQPTEYYFYRSLPYGSEAQFHPLGVLMNGGLDVLQSYFSSPHASAIPWKAGATSIWRSSINAGNLISKYGWNRFLRQEVFPLRWNVREMQWAPNYLLHTIGGGMEFRKLSEWYDAHDVPVPYFAGAVSAMAYHAVNEIVENGPGYRPNLDAVADLLIFDPLGIILFHFDGVAKYFSETWQLNDWSPQPAISFAPVAFRNFGHSFGAKLRFSSAGTTGLFIYLGKSSLLGLTLKQRDEESFSFGFGATQTGVWEVDAINEIPTRSIRVGFTVGAFYDRNNSLLASVMLSEYYLERFRLNVYPGVVTLGAFSPGFFVTIGSRWSFAAGITLRAVPIGLAFTSPR